MANRAPLPAALVVPFLLLSGAGVSTCSFPDVTLGSGGSTAGAAGSSTIGGSGGVGDTTMTAGAGGVGGTPAPTGGAGDGGGGSSGSGGGATTSTTSEECPVDKDGDLAISWECAGGTDCADDDVNANPGIVDYSASPIQNEAAPNTDPYDKNCDGIVEKETKVLGCALFQCPGGKGFKSDVPCGVSAPLGHCGGFFCSFQAENPAQSKTQRCR